MAKEEFQANWRGARKYQFDEEARRKRAALDRKFSDPDPVDLAQPDEPIRNAETPAPQSTAPVAQAPRSRRRRRRLSIATMLLLVTVASIAGYVTTWFLEGHRIVWPALRTTVGASQNSALDPSLPSDVPLPPNRPRNGGTQ